MNPEKSPFVKKKIPCPVCEARVENRFIMPKSYLEKNVESDRHVLEYKWLDEAFQGFHPPFYHFWHCPRCKYTATQNDFLKPTRDSGNNFAMIKRCLRNMSPANKETTDTLAHEINYEKMDFSVALNAHLLAVFIQELIPDKERNPSKLGSYWLRTAWLIREQKAGGDPGGLWAEQMKLLEKVAGTWPEAPHSEADCLKKAAAYYKTAYENHPRYDDMVKATDLMILIADVSFRAGDFKASMQSLNTVMQTGQKLRAKQQELIRREKEAGKLTLARKSQIESQGSKINTLMEKAGDMRKEIVRIRIRRQEPKARAAIEKLKSSGMDPEAIRKKLKEANFEPALLTKLLGEPKRKKFLGVL